MRCTVDVTSSTRQDMQGLAMQDACRKGDPWVALSTMARCSKGAVQGPAAVIARRSALLHGLQSCCHQHVHQGGQSMGPT